MQAEDGIRDVERSRGLGDVYRGQVHESSENAELFHLDSEAALREAFSKRVLGGERGAWLFNYDPMTVPLV